MLLGDDMTTEISKADPFVAIEKVLIQGDLSSLTAEQKTKYYSKVCETMGLNSLTKPFEYIKLNGKEVLYATKGAAEQLRKVHGVSIRITSTVKVDDVYVVVVEAVDRSGRTDSATGAVSVAGLKGDALANAFLKSETKAKRRVTLSICGLNMLDESEVDSIPTAEKKNPWSMSQFQPSPEDGGGVSDNKYRFPFGQWSKKTPEEVYNDEKAGPLKMIEYLDLLDAHVAAGKYPDKHQFFPEAQKQIVDFLLGCDFEEAKQAARTWQFQKLAGETNE